MPVRDAFLIALPALLFAALAVPLIVTGYEVGSNAADQRNFHWPKIEQFATQWPHLDVKNYGAAFPLGYHLVLAAARVAFGLDLKGTQMLSALLTVGFLLTLTWAAAKRVGAPYALLLSLPLVASLYVFQAGVWLMTDNPAWWAVLVFLLLILRPRLIARDFTAASALLVAMVLVRHIHLWTAVPLAVAAWTQPHAAPLRPWKRVAPVALTLLPAFALAGAMFLFWGGLVPPSHNTAHAQVVAWSEPALFLSLYGVYGLFFLPFFWSPLRRWARDHPALLAGVLLGAAVTVLLPPTDYDVAARRIGGLWNVVALVPAPGQRSLLLFPMAAIGALVGAGWVSALVERGQRREAIILATAAAAFVAVNVVNLPYQRYNEVFVLILLILPALLVLPQKGESRTIPLAQHPMSTQHKALLVAGLISLVAFLGIITWVTLAP